MSILKRTNSYGVLLLCYSVVNNILNYFIRLLAVKRIVVQFELVKMSFGHNRLRMLSAAAQWRVLSYFKDSLIRTGNIALFVALMRRTKDAADATVDKIEVNNNTANSEQKVENGPQADIAYSDTKELLQREAVPKDSESEKNIDFDAISSPEMHQAEFASSASSGEKSGSILSLNLPAYFGRLKFNFSSSSKSDPQPSEQYSTSNSNDSVPKWKLKKRTLISKASVDSRTRYLVNCIKQSRSVEDSVQVRRLEDLCSHLRKYPFAQGLAIKEGGVSGLLKLQRSTANEDVNNLLRESLSLLGYSSPVKGRGIRILSIDGGGTRGLSAIETLRVMEDTTGQSVHEMFDLICGVSTGSILACLLGAQRMNLDDCAELYRDISIKIFTQNTFMGTSGLVWSHSYYDTTLWENLLKQNMGTTKLIDSARNIHTPKIAAISAIVNQLRVQPFVFRNYNLPYRSISQYAGSSEYMLWEAVRASAAAPSYFQEFSLGDHLHQDGGILVNNPCAVAIHESRMIWPDVPIQCIVSLGTGRYLPVAMESLDPDQKGKSLSWKAKFAKILDSATDTEAVHTMLHDLLPPQIYYRFNPTLSSVVSLDEVSETALSRLLDDTSLYLRQNELKLKKACDTLMLKKSSYQKWQDTVAQWKATMS